MTNGNDAAFARPLGEVLNPGEPAISDEQTGLTKREYFAAIILPAIIALESDAGMKGECHDAVHYADALIDALNEESK